MKTVIWLTPQVNWGLARAEVARDETTHIAVLDTAEGRSEHLWLAAWRFLTRIAEIRPPVVR